MIHPIICCYGDASLNRPLVTWSIRGLIRQTLLKLTFTSTITNVFFWLQFGTWEYLYDHFYFVEVTGSWRTWTTAQTHQDCLKNGLRCRFRPSGGEEEDEPGCSAASSSSVSSGFSSSSIRRPARSASSRRAREEGGKVLQSRAEAEADPPGSHLSAGRDVPAWLQFAMKFIRVAARHCRTAASVRFPSFRTQYKTFNVSSSFPARLQCQTQFRKCCLLSRMRPGTLMTSLWHHQGYFLCRASEDLI